VPLSQTYSRYFGGELDIKSMEGFGTDVYLHLNLLGDSCENLPPKVQGSPAAGASTWPTPPRYDPLRRHNAYSARDY
ncbi:hypothetical protein T484DRAFT_1821555, partial [Baffinella frigidus]